MNREVEKRVVKHVFVSDELKALPTLLYGKGVSQQTIATLLGRDNTGGLNGVIHSFIKKYAPGTEASETADRAMTAVHTFMQKQRETLREKDTAVDTNRLFLRRADLAKLLGVGYSTIMKWEREGNILPPPRTVGNISMWHRADIEAWAKDAGTDATGPAA